MPAQHLAWKHLQERLLPWVMKSYSPACQVHWSCSFSKLSPFRLQGGRVLLMFHGPLTRYVTLRIEHAPVMPGTFSPLPTSKKTTISIPSMHHGTCVMHVPWYMSGLLISGGGETFPVHAQPAFFFVSGKRPIPFVPPCICPLCRVRSVVCCVSNHRQPEC